MQLSELEAHRHTVATRSGEVSYLDIGTGPAALFVHGIATNAYLWRNVISALTSQASGQRRYIAVDLPLHGQSPVTAEQDLSLAALAAGLEDFCDALGLTGIDLVANDTGGAVAQIFAARHPERLATLTLSNCDAGDNVPPESFKPTVELARSGNLAPSAVALFADLEAAAQISFGSGYEHLDRVDRAVLRSYLEPCIGTLERARHFERMLAALDAADLTDVTPLLGPAHRAHAGGVGDRGHVLRRLLGLLAAGHHPRHDPGGHDRRRPAVLPGRAGHGRRAAPGAALGRGPGRPRLSIRHTAGRRGGPAGCGRPPRPGYRPDQHI
jgi:pimeloyl-ACP methyl ester carboxylesterase